MANKDLQVRFGVGHLSYQKKQRTRIVYKSPTQITGDWISENCSSAEWYPLRGEGVLNLRRDVDTIGGGASTDYSPFYGNTSVTEVVLPNEITTIGDYAFDGCTNLDKVVITSEVPPTLGDNVFEDTTTVYVPYEYLDAYGEAWGDEVEIAPIGDYYQITVTAGEHGSATGSGWYALNESVVLTATADEGYEFTQWSDGNTDNPRTITVLGDATYTCAFQALKLIRYTSTNQASGNWVTNNTDTTRNTYDSVTGNGVLYLNEGVTEIGGGYSKDYSPFNQDSGLTAVDLDDAGLTTIGDYAFRSCSGLTSITIPNTVTSIGSRTFIGCSGLSSINIPSNVTSIGSRAFESCTGLTSITIPSGVTSIAGDTFLQCSSLVSITVDSNNTTFNDGNGSNCIIETSTNTLVVGCKNTTIPNGVTSIGRYAFYFCTTLTSITIPNSVTSIAAEAFGSCSGLTSITIPNSVTTIGSGAFGNCTNLTSVTLPNNITSLVGFSGCSSLSSIAIPSSVTSIGTYALSNCTGLTSLTIPSGVTNIGWSAIDHCTNLTSVTCEATTPPTLGTDNFNASNDTLYVPAASVSAYQADSSWSSAFTTITAIVVPAQIRYTSTNQASGTWVTNNTDTTKNTYDSVTGNGVLYLNAGVTGIGGNNWSTDDTPFYGDSGLTAVDLSDAGLIYIGQDAFVDCSALTSINIPSSITNVDGYSFAGCSALVSMTVDSNNTYLNDGNGSNCIIKTSNNQLLSGCNTTVIPNTVLYIQTAAFSGRTGLTSITIPSGVTSIPQNTFDNCSGLTSATIGSGVTSIGRYAFNCSNLTSVTCEATTPPTFDPNYYNFTASNDTLYVPSASVSAYQADSNWSAAFTTITAIPTPVQHTISYTTDDPQYGASAVDGNWVTNNTDTTQNTYATVAGQWGNIGEGVLYLNSGVTTIGGGQSTAYSPFYESGMNHYTDGIDLSDSGLTSIGDYGLYDCSAEFQSDNPLVIPEGVTTIGDHGLGVSSTGGSDCYYDLPSTLTSIASNGIYIGGSKGGIAVLICRAATPPTLGTNSISAPDGLWTLQVPAASVSAYQSSAWGSLGFSTITAIS